LYFQASSWVRQRRVEESGERSVLENILLDTMFGLPSIDGVDELMIDKKVVEGRKDPIRVYAEEAGRSRGPT
jgi:ATP-dependent Clp protease ATP-binding subunit ClpX